ncbi:MAG: hypothetical protein U0807_10580 [Candidatus Binatia bacterium]
MAFFRSARREPPPAAPAPPPVRAAPVAATPPPQPTAPPIAARLREIAATALAPEDALEPALQSIVEGIGVTAGAVCLYDARRELLRLAVETGLSDDGCRKLRNVRRSDPVTWDMPLQGLLNRRVYLIDNAAQNRYVPPLVEQAGSMRTVACLPLLSGTSPLGSLILIAVGAQVITELTLRTLQEPLRELAQMIETVRRRVAGEAAPAAPPPRTPGPAGAEPATKSKFNVPFAPPATKIEAPAPTPTASRVDVPATPPRPELIRSPLPIGATIPSTEAAELASVKQALTAAQSERNRLAAELDAVRTAGAESVAAAEARVAQHIAALEALRAEVATQARAHHQQVHALTANLEEAERNATRAEHLRAELDASLQSHTAATDMDLDQARAAARTAEAARDAAIADATSARLAFTDAEADRAHQRAEVARLTSDVERTTAEARAAIGDRDRLEAQLRDVSARTEATAAAHAGREHELTAEVERLRVHLAEAESLVERERAQREALEAASLESAPELQAAVHAAQQAARNAEEARAAATAEAAAAQSTLAERDAQLAELAAALEQARTTVATLEVATRETRAEREALAHEHGLTRARLAQLETDATALHDEQVSAAERERLLHEALSAANAERQRLEDSQEELRARERDAAHRAGEAEAELTALRDAAARSAQALDTLEAQHAALEAQHEELEAGHRRLVERHHELEARGKRFEEQYRTTQDQLLVREEERDAFQEQARVLSEQNRALAHRLEELIEAELAREAAWGVIESVTDELQGEETSDIEPGDESDAGAGAPQADAAAADDTSADDAAGTSRAARVLSLVPTRDASVTTPGTHARHVEAEPKILVVLDAHLAWEALAVGDRQVVVVSPESDIAARLAEIGPARLLANLAVPGVFDAITALRAAGSTQRVWGCVGAPGTGKVLRLGMIEATPRPLDPDAVLGLLAGYAARGTRVFTAGADADALISLRQALSRQGMSVSIAWDAKQAADMLGVVRPEVAVIDLELPPRDGFAVAAQLGGLDPLPNLVLVTAGEDIAAGFTAALAGRAATGLARSLEAVVIDVLRRKETPPSDRR